MFACNGILFNHESPRRGETFVTRKITRGLTRVARNRPRREYRPNRRDDPQTNRTSERGEMISV
jgi:hypothetical protein